MISGNANPKIGPYYEKKVLLSVVIPTLHEYENLLSLVPELIHVLNSSKDVNNSYEIIIVDDESEKRTLELISSFEEQDKIVYLPSSKKRGLAQSALEGFSIAKGIIVVLMDGDCSHNPRDIPKLLDPILRGNSDMVVGSRYTKGGSTSSWSMLRKTISKLAAYLAKPISGLNDSGSGFFAFRKDQIELDQIKPISWKVGLEICSRYPDKISEVPIHFKNRELGKSKLNFRNCFDFLRHVLLLYLGNISWLRSVSRN